MSIVQQQQQQCLLSIECHFIDNNTWNLIIQTLELSL